jgi:glutamyl-tRNA synthetase/nondiscriminating glutamyl-tRNA synthetase
MSSHDPTSRLHKEAINVVLRQAGAQAAVKGRQLYHPVRLALTGSDYGPELTTLLTLLPAGLIRQRIQTVLSIFSHSNHKE